jgi:hypothetical protein
MLKTRKAANEMIEQYSKVKLKTGEIAVIIEVFEAGASFLADIKKGEQDYETDEIGMADIASVFVEVETPVEAGRA